MGVDSRVQQLTKRAITSLASITGVRLWSGKTGDADEKALGVELPELLSSSIVAGTTIDYKGLTPKGFYNSVATTSRKGIVEHAAEAEIPTETTGKVITSDLQEAMREHWASASDNAEGGGNQLGRPKVWQQDGIGEGETTPSAYKFTICFNVNKPDTTTKVYYPVPFSIPTGKKILFAKINGLYVGQTAGVIDNLYVISTVNGEIQLGSSTFKIVFPGTTSPVYIQNSRSGKSSCILDVYAVVV